MTESNLKKLSPKKTTNNWELDERPRKKGDAGQDNDTLGFLKEAEAEKQAIANRKEQVNNVVGKSIDALLYDFNCSVAFP